MKDVRSTDQKKTITGDRTMTITQSEINKAIATRNFNTYKSSMLAEKIYELCGTLDEVELIELELYQKEYDQLQIIIENCADDEKNYGVTI